MKAKRSLGTKLLLGAVPVGGLTEIGGIELTADTIDITTLDSDSGYREFIAGFKDAGEVSASGFFVNDAGQVAALASFEDGEVVASEIKFPAAIGFSWTFDAIVVGYSTSTSLEDPVSFELTLKVVGKPTLAATTGA